MNTNDNERSLLAENERLRDALKAVRSRRDRINAALGYEFVGEYVDAALDHRGKP